MIRMVYTKPHKYPARSLPLGQPDTTPLAGTEETEVLEEFYIPLPVEVQLQPDAEISRVQLAQFYWQGGDPAVDAPLVTIERKDNDEWIEVTTPSGRLVSEKYQIFSSHICRPLSIQPMRIKSIIGGLDGKPLDQSKKWVFRKVHIAFIFTDIDIQVEMILGLGTRKNTTSPRLSSNYPS